MGRAFSTLVNGDLVPGRWSGLGLAGITVRLWRLARWALRDPGLTGRNPGFCGEARPWPRVGLAG